MTIRNLLIPMVGLGTLLAACAPGAVSETELDEHLCSPEALGDDYQELVRGDFTPRDLAELADPHEGRERELRDAGMERGKFVYYKSVLEKPPFEPPIEVVCQAMEFESEADARSWVNGLDGEAAGDSLLFGRPPDDLRRSEELGIVDGPAGRLFQVRMGGVRTASIFVAAEGRFVRSVALGTEAQADASPMGQLFEIWGAER